MGKIVFLLTVALAVSASSPALAATWHVSESVESSGDGASWGTAFKRIQEGIDASSDGDTVIVGPGTYVENIRFSGKNITLRSTDPLDPAIVAATIIDGNQSGSVVTFDGTEDETCCLRGFTIRNGGADYGAGITGSKAGLFTQATIERNQIRDNSASIHGGAVAHCDGAIVENRIVANSATGMGGGLYDCNGLIAWNVIIGDSAGHGGGLAKCQATISGNVLSDNTATREGGGLYMCDRMISGNQITGCSGSIGAALADCDGSIQRNTISLTKWGSSVLEDCDGLIEGNAITGNSGTAIYDCDGTIGNNLVAGNRGKGGGGISECEGIIVNNTIVNNWAAAGGGICYSQGVIVNCVIWGNDATYDYLGQVYSSNEPTYSCIQDWSGDEGNTAEDPQFVDPDGPDNKLDTYQDNDYHLLPDSPCIDAGENWMLDPASLDLEGNLRIAFGGKSLTVDMGTYEYNSSPFAISQIFMDNDSLVITWHSQPNDTYVLWFCTDPAFQTWARGATIPSDGATTTFTVVSIAPFPDYQLFRIEMTSP
ncbi:MAG: right-handed parallel beta-helix repeat-containing protein [bacterium]|nr:right-handed parallel beta-helix repeat-containing protein [bacterium]